MNTFKHTMAASLVALIAAAPTFAQSDKQPGGQQSTATQAEQNQQSSGRQMPQAATPQGQDLSNLADVQTPRGEVGAGADTGGTVLLDIEGFSQSIYERGFRQGYLRGIADARERLISEMRQARAMRQRAMQEGQAAQEDRMESAAGGQTVDSPGATDPSAGGAPLGQVGEPVPGGTQQQQQQQMAGESGAIIVLPPGMTPQMFIDRVMETNEATQQQGG